MNTSGPRAHPVLKSSEKMEAAMKSRAEYTGVSIALRETGESISREARIVEAFEDSNAYARSFAYATGPALGLLLDLCGPGWRTGIAKAGRLIQCSSLL